MNAAVVIGLCSHGLSVSRALTSRGVKVFAVESNDALPGFKTNSATVLKTDSINSEKLIPYLQGMATTFGVTEKAVLFPTNDTMVGILADHWEELKDSYLLSWSDHTDLVKGLQLKDVVEEYCRSKSIYHPFSRVVNNTSEIDKISDEMGFPLIVKPVTPMSGFKVKLINNRKEFESAVEQYSVDLPFLAQHWIEGGDDKLVFASMCFEKGKPVASFSGRKLAASPPGMGQGTIMEPFLCPKAEELSISLFEGSGFTGPVSVEFKIDPEGKYWLIEPNIGRTEFSVECAIKNGVDLPYVEYLTAIGSPVEKSKQQYKYIWLDTEKDLAIYVKKAVESRSIYVNGKCPAFPYFNSIDLVPFCVALLFSLKRVIIAIKKRMAFNRPTTTDYPDYNVETVTSIRIVEDKIRALTESIDSDDMFLCYEWFDNYIKTILEGNGGLVKIFYLETAQSEPLAILPMLETKNKFGGRSLSSISNYYSPYFDIIFDKNKIDRSLALRIILEKKAHEISQYTDINFTPVKNEVSKHFLEGVDKYWLAPSRTLKYSNWVHEISSFDAFEAQLSSQIKNTIKRKTKKLEKEHGYQFKVITEKSDALLRYGEYQDVYAKSWKRNEAYPDFIKGLLELSADKKLLRFGVIIVNGKPVASQLWFVENKQASIYKLVYDPAYSKYSVGTILTYEMSKYCIEVDEVGLIDFLTGNDSFKKEWMTTKNKLFSLQFYNLRTVTGLFKAIWNASSSIKKRMVS